MATISHTCHAIKLVPALRSHSNSILLVIFHSYFSLSLSLGNIGQTPQQGGGMPQQVQQVGGQPTMNTMNMQQVAMNPSAPNYNQPRYQQVSSGIRPNSIPGNDMGMGMQQPPQYGHPMYPRGGGMAPRPSQPSYNTMRMPNQQGE